jgi:hypothetical protein
VFSERGTNCHLIVSEGCAESLIAELRGSLEQRDAAAVATFVRDAKHI